MFLSVHVYLDIIAAPLLELSSCRNLDYALDVVGLTFCRIVKVQSFIVVQCQVFSVLGLDVIVSCTLVLLDSLIYVLGPIS